MNTETPGEREARELIEQLRTVQAGGLAAKLMLEAAHWIEDAIASPPIAPGEPRWICLDGMNPDELAAYDYGCASMQTALQSILDGKDSGEGAANEPWESMRRRVIALVLAAKAQAPAEPAGFDRTTALLLLSAASKSGNEGAIRLAAQLACAAQCHGCGYVNFHCRCAAPKAPAENTSATEGVRADAAVLLGKEIEELIATEFGITGGTIHSKVHKLVVLAAGNAPVEYPPV